jgi:hypothetical protein
LVITLVGVVQNVQRSVSAGGLSRIPGVGVDLTCVECGLPLICRFLSPVALTSLNVRDVVPVMPFLVCSRRVHAVRLSIRPSR